MALLPAILGQPITGHHPSPPFSTLEYIGGYHCNAVEYAEAALSRGCWRFGGTFFILGRLGPALQWSHI
jgi:hypothetical protein